MKHVKKKLLSLVLSGSLLFSMALPTTLTTTLADAAAGTILSDKADINAKLKAQSVEKELDGTFFSVTGFAQVTDRSDIKEGDSRYAVVNNEKEFFEALTKAKNGTVEVIELRCDLNLGIKELSEEAKAAGSDFIEAYKDSNSLSVTPVGNPELIESGVSQFKLSNVDGLTIFSKTGSTIRHAEFGISTGANDIVLRNLQIEGMWEWDDRTGTGLGTTGGDGSHKRSGWTSVKLNGCSNVWLDHCSLGIAFDGCLDIENGATGISLTWCKFGEMDVDENGNIKKDYITYKTAQYLEALYQRSIEENNSKISFQNYASLRSKYSVDDMVKLMSYHSKCHLCGSGDGDTWLVPALDENGEVQYDESDKTAWDAWKAANSENSDIQKIEYLPTLVTEPDYEKESANERIMMTMAYNQYYNMGQRLPMIRGGTGHLFNCYFNNENTENYPDNKLNRGMDARDGASIAADTCVYYNARPMTGHEYQKADRGNLNADYLDYFTYNYAMIVNSKVTNNKGNDTYTGNSYDVGGKSNLLRGDRSWFDNSTLDNFSWHNLALVNAYDAEKITDETVALEKYDKLSYEYQTFPLDDVINNTDLYGGAYTLNLSAEEWLKTSYAADFSPKLLTDEDLAEPTGLKLNKTTANVFLDEKEYLQLSADVLPYNSKNTEADVTWTSSDEGVATVNETGLVTPVAYGKATITANLGDVKATCEVSVEKSVTDIKIENIPETIYTGDIFTLSAAVTPEDVLTKDVSWNSMAPTSIRLIDGNNGTFQAIAAGTNREVTATSKLTGNRLNFIAKRGSARLRIVDPAVAVTDVTMSVSTTELEPGKDTTLTAKVVPDNATNQKIYWTSSDETVATVDDNGKVTSLKEGTAVITATSMNYGKTAECTVTVAEKAPVTEPPATEPPVTEPTQTPNTTAPGDKTDLPNTPAPGTDTPAPTEPNKTDEPSVLPGDVNEDGEVKLDDANIALRAALGIGPDLEDSAFKAADVNGDGKISLEDANIILRMALGIPVDVKRIVLVNKLGL